MLFIQRKMCYIEAYMKVKSGHFCVFFLCAFFFSCALNSADSTEESENSADDSFLKAYIELKSRQNRWSAPISDTAAISAKTLLGADDSIMATPENAAAVLNTADSPVFPSISGFGSLDLSHLSSEAKNALDGFCAALCQKSGFDFMQPKREYELSLFFFDLEEKWRSIFNSDFPDERIFSSWKYAAPFFLDDAILVPVRFFSGEYFLDTEIYLFETEDGWKVNQIRAQWRQKNAD